MTYEWFLHFGLPALISSIPLALVSLLGIWLQSRKTRQHFTTVTEQQTAQLLSHGQNGGT